MLVAKIYLQLFQFHFLFYTHAGCHLQWQPFTNLKLKTNPYQYHLCFTILVIQKATYF